MSRKPGLIVGVLAGLLLACRTLVPGPAILPTLVPTQSEESTPLPTLQLSATPQATPSATPEPTREPTLTPSTTRTSTLTPSPTLPRPTPTPLGLTLQLEVFEDLWQTVRANYLYPDFNGLDWQAVREEYRARVELGLSNADFYAALSEMVARLGDDHSAFLTPEEAQEEDAEFEGNLEYVGIGVLAAPITETVRAVILVTFPGSPAQIAGLKPRDSILAIDGGPALDENGSVARYLRGVEGTWVTLEVQSPGDDPRIVMVRRSRISGAVPVPYEVIETPAGKRIGYIALVTLADGTVPSQIEVALEAMTAEGPLDGLVLDNRENEGGLDTVLQGALSYFTSGRVGYFTNREDRRPFDIRARDVGGSQQVPLVVLVGENTVSFGEVFAGVLETMGRAVLIGETTLGNVEILWGYDFEDGSRAWIAHDTFEPANGEGVDWETSGIIPDRFVAGNWYDYPLESDPGVLAALEVFAPDSER